jgi:hypothetical protein
MAFVRAWAEELYGIGSEEEGVVWLASSRRCVYAVRELLRCVFIVAGRMAGCRPAGGWRAEGRSGIASGSGGYWLAVGWSSR